MHYLLTISTATLVMLTAAAASAQDATPLPAGPDSHLFFGASACSLPAGHGYFSVLGLGVPFVQFGVTDRLSMGVGTPVVVPGRVMLFTPKYELYRGPATSVAAGMAHMALFGAGGANVVYVVATNAGTNGSVTGGAGMLTAFGGHDRARTIVGMIGGERRLSTRTTLITENYLFPEIGSATVSGGVRLPRGRFATDLGLMVFVFDKGVVPGPVVNLSWRF